jgi:response regulator of citrate/malate metabolism
MNVLVVEDEALVALLVQEIVEESGHVCVGPVGSLGEACALIDSCHVDAALLDIWLKNDEFVYPATWKLASRDVPFAFVSARAADGIDPAFAGRPLIPKPMDERRVKGWLEEVVSGRGQP